MAARTISLDPTPGKLIFALRAIGYTLPQAVADLVDNSINAKAANVEVCVMSGPKGITRILIGDDGKGMTRSELDESMRLGSDTHRSVNSLGKYGMGLKLASLSQAQTMTVISRSKAHVGGRRWTIDGISRGWKCEVLEDAEVLQELDNPFDSVDMSRSGTLVIWQDLDKIKASKNGVEATVSLLFSHLKQHLGLHFHRFIEDEALNIFLERVDSRRPQDYRTEKVTPLNPFAYEVSGDPAYPTTFRVDLGDHQALDLEAHIWPPNATSAHYRLAGKTAARQGFYFYRNNRLIQAGGWNEARNSEAEPHLSLARIRVDLPKELDESFGLSVQKASIQVPPTFNLGLEKAQASDKTPFADYVKQAQRTYRAGEKKNVANHPAVPDVGLHKSLRRELHRILTGSGGKARRVSFTWEPLAHNALFELRRESHQIALNSFFRKRVLQGKPATSGDAALIKVCLFMMTRELLFSERFSSQQREQVEELNRVLLATLDTLAGG